MEHQEKAAPGERGTTVDAMLQVNPAARVESGGSITAGQVTVAELQAALRAVWAGEFRTGNGPAPTRAAPPHRRPGWALSGRVVMVVGCHGGAGASTVALAVAEAGSESPGWSARLLDCASPERSGLLSAVDAELGQDGSGWRQGRRSRLPIERVGDAVACAADIPPPPEQPGGHRGVTVLDAGWAAGDVLTGDSWLTQASESAAVVLVARATIPGLRHLERALVSCGGAPVVALVGGHRRWARSVNATAGPLFGAARRAGRVVDVAADRHLAVTGITNAPLPRKVSKAGGEVLARAVPAAGTGGAPRAYPQTTSPQGILHEVDP